ncbi:sugar transferase [Francisella sp. Scap27]|uniref:sugar transferase n=1 Tax=Francisella sp. Scap27 TaxID=2589986 RepID=UPI0015BA4876|nr:sugar transferase [Francisella sp. Scap27]QLE78521.1 sugar transferase [Francisella sp. Scap27]
MFVYIKIFELVVSVVIILASYSIPLHFFNYNPSNFSSFNFLAVFMAIIAILILLLAEYTNGEKVSKTKNILKVIISSLAIAIVITALAFFLRGFSFPRSIILIGFVVQVVFLSFTRVFFRSLIRKTIYNNILLIGLSDEQQWIFEKAESSKLPKEKLGGYFEVDNDGYDLETIVSQYTKAFISDKALKIMTDDDLACLSQNNIEIVVIPRKYEISIWGAMLVPLGDSVAMSVRNFGLSFEAQIVKRIFDIVFSVIFIIISSPIMLITALAIYLEDKKNPFFVQERVTKHNKNFKLIKFRSMSVDAESATGAVWATNDDARITIVGKLIRPLWIDELPQFFNVLKGDMSIVGPRPERQQLIEEFTKDTPEFSYRTKVKAGITGYAQVLTSYSTLPENKLKLDLIYIRRWSFLFDLLIIIETVRVICMKFIGIFLPSKKEVSVKIERVVDGNYIRYI